MSDCKSLLYDFSLLKIDSLPILRTKLSLKQGWQFRSCCVCPFQVF
jgi:hypothetical protein